MGSSVVAWDINYNSILRLVVLTGILLNVRTRLVEQEPCFVSI